MSDTHALEEAIADSELLYINFFNGRLLAAGDLTQEQTVNRARARHLGQALGTGVAFGLEVAPAAGSAPTAGLVEIAAGLAVNPAGQTLRLEAKQTIALVQPPDPSQTADCLFSDCELIPSGSTASTAGYYLLTIAPATRKDGLAPVSGLGNQIAPCNSKYFSDGVKFRFLRLPINTGEQPLRIRNALAYLCLGRPTVAPSDFLTAALVPKAATDYGIGTLLATGQLTDADVPLALVEWKGATGLGFIDLWAVRRRTERPSVEGFWDFFIGDRKKAEGEAAFLQFQNHIESLIADSTASTQLRADTVCKFLPPVGILPNCTGPNGAGPQANALFDWRTFLGPLGPEQEIPIDIDLWNQLIRETLLLEPILVLPFGQTSQFGGIDFFAFPNLPPVHVYRIPGRDEVLFVRSRLGRVRVFATGGTAAVALANQPFGIFLAPPQRTDRGWLTIDPLPGGLHRVGWSAEQSRDFKTTTRFNPASFISENNVFQQIQVVEGRTTDWNGGYFHRD